MVWKTLPLGNGIKYFSISDEINKVLQEFLQFLINLSPGVIFLFFGIYLAMFIFFIFLTFKYGVDVAYD